MPIFQDPDERCKQNTRNTALTLEQQEGRRGVMRCPTEQKEEADNGRREVEEAEMEDMGDVARVESLLRRLEGARMETSDRVELIERIKRGESPTWVPGRAVSGCSLPLSEWLVRLHCWRAPAYVKTLGGLQLLLKKLTTRPHYLSGVFHYSLLSPTCFFGSPQKS
jgi:hypothetical protein